ncbi:MAG: GNAT family N-acetyltransferase [Bacteroidales bacterium]|nr:GNAT family N-acetyltransferase [Bacteroidales bacterium]MBP5240323.1 GNAT family N-acetyltransferase [Bacteroidales bacterium]
MSVVFSNAFLSHTDRNFAKSLLESAFPAEERPSFEAMERRGDEYRLCVVQKDAKNIGVFGYWNFRKTVYIEHFAISEPLRNNGLGGEVLGTFLNQLHSDMQVVLEAELPDNTLAQRRIGFYQRHGFTANTFEYLQPPYRPGDGFLPMLLLSRNPLNEKEYEEIRDVLYKKVYGIF